MEACPGSAMADGFLKRGQIVARYSPGSSGNSSPGNRQSLVFILVPARFFFHLFFV